MAKRMTNQVKRMVEVANESFKMRHLKDEYDETFTTVSWLLIQAGCYHGYNYFKADGTLSGGNYDEYFDHIEFYIV